MEDDFTKLGSLIDNICLSPEDIGKAFKTCANITRKNYNTMHPISHDCLNCKHRHCEEAYDYEWGRIYIYKHWCGIDRTLMNCWSANRKPMPENCPHYEYGEPTIHRMSNEEKTILQNPKTILYVFQSS